MKSPKPYDPLAGITEHVSWYNLEFEQGTAFTEMRDQGFLQEPDEETTAHEYSAILEGLSKSGFQQYELFSFGKRWANLPDLSAYIQRHCEGDGSCISEAEELSPPAKARELLMTQLRLLNGVHEEVFHQQSGHRIEDLLGASLQVWQDAGWVERTNKTLKLLPDAYLISDSLFREFV